MAKPEPKYPTIEEIETHIETDEGWCIYCGKWKHDCCEPDASEYECPECEQNTVYHAEELVIQGFVN